MCGFTCLEIAMLMWIIVNVDFSGMHRPYDDIILFILQYSKLRKTISLVYQII